MKKLLIILCFISMSVQAKYLKATLTFESGEIKKGFAELIEMNASKVKFKLAEEGNVENILSSELKKIEYVNVEGDLIIAEKLFVNMNKGKKGIKQKKKKYWLYVIYSDGIKLAVDVFSPIYWYNGNHSVMSGGGTMLYIGKEKEDSVLFTYALADMMSININMDKIVRKNCELLFKDCPRFLEAVNAENFKKTTLINRLLKLYVDNKCK